MTSSSRAQGTQSLTIVGWLPAQLANSHLSPWEVRKRRQAAKTMAWTAAKQAGWRFVPGKVHLTVTLVFSVNRKRDTDNLYARVAGLVNGLKRDFFTDDSTDYLDLVVRADVRKGVKQTEITLEPAEQ